MKIRMSQADREQHGGPEWLDWEPNRLTVSEAEALQEHAGVEVADYRGPTGWLVNGGVTAIKWALWVSLRRAGVTADWVAFDPDVLAVTILRDPEPEPEAEVAPGKGRSTRRSRSAGAAKN